MHWNLGRGRLVFCNMQAVWASAAMAAPKKGGFRFVSDYCVVNKQIEKVPGVMPNQEVKMNDLPGATCFGKHGMLQGYWQITGGRSLGSVHHRHPRRSVYPQGCGPRYFKPDGLLPWYSGRINQLV